MREPDMEAPELDAACMAIPARALADPDLRDGMASESYRRCARSIRAGLNVGLMRLRLPQVGRPIASALDNTKKAAPAAGRA